MPCARDRSATIVHNVMERMGDSPVRFLTLTLRADGEPLAKSIRRLTAAFTVLRRRAVWRHAVTGGVAFVEVHWSKTGQRWHPHLHCLLQGRYLPKQSLATAWESITGDSRIIDIRLVRTPKLIARYVTKYAAKPLDASYIHDQHLLDEAVEALKGRRMCIPFGRWSDVTLTCHPKDGEWINVGDFEFLVHRAARGDEYAKAVVVSVAPLDAHNLIDEARRRAPPQLQAPLAMEQLTFYGAWDEAQRVRPGSP